MTNNRRHSLDLRDGYATRAGESGIGKRSTGAAMTRKPTKPGARRKSQQKGAQWERFVSEQWLKRLKAVGVLTTFHKLEPTKVGDRFTKDAGADFVCCTSSGHYIAIECKATDKTASCDRRCPRCRLSTSTPCRCRFLRCGSGRRCSLCRGGRFGGRRCGQRKA